MKGEELLSLLTDLPVVLLLVELRFIKCFRPFLANCSDC